MKNKKISFSKLLFLCFITTVIVVELTFSKYESTFSKSTDATVAIMANDVLSNIVIPDGIYPGSAPVVVAITVTNEDNGRVCQVSQDYMIKIERPEQINIPFEFELYKDKECTESLDINEDGYYYDSSFNFDAGIKDEKKYYLKIYWPEEYNDASYAFEIDYFRFIVDTIQRD